MTRRAWVMFAGTPFTLLGITLWSAQDGTVQKLDISSLEELVNQMVAAMEQHDWDELIFCRPLVESLERLAADPKWNPGAIAPKSPVFPFSGTCACGWPLLADGSCSNGDCPDSLEQEEEWGDA